MKHASIIALMALAPAVAAAADFSGTWKLENSFNGSVSVIHCTIVQTEDALSGSCKPDLPGMEASRLAGSVKGSTAKWGYDLVFNGNPARVDYEVTLAADGSLTGKLLRNGNDSPIKGVRQLADKAQPGRDP